jgi:hypothetical protein
MKSRAINRVNWLKLIGGSWILCHHSVVMWQSVMGELVLAESECVSQQSHSLAEGE